MSESNGSAESLDVSDVKEPKKDSVAYETYRRAMGELKSAQARLKEIELANQAANENKLKENNEWKLLAESKEKSHAEILEKYMDLESTIVNSYKINAVQKLIGGKIKDEAYYQFIDTDGIAFNPETKTIDQDSAQLAASKFTKRHRDLIDFGTNKMPNEAAVSTKFGDKNVENMSMQEIEAALRKLGK
jgi:hypothetical protein